MLHAALQPLRLLEQIAEVEAHHATVFVGQRQRVEARRPKVVPSQLEPVLALARARQHGREPVHHQAPGRCDVLIAVAQRRNPVGIEDRVIAPRGKGLGRRPQLLRRLVDDPLGPERLHRLDLVGASDHPGHVAADVAQDLHQHAPHPTRGGVHQRLRPALEPSELHRRMPSGQADRGQHRRLLVRPPLGASEHLMARHHDLARVAAEASDREDLVPFAQVVDPVAALGHRARHLEAGGDGPPHVLLGRGVQPHPNDAVGVVDPAGGHRNADMARRQRRSLAFFEDEPVIRTGTMDDDGLHGRASGER